MASPSEEVREPVLTDILLLFHSLRRCPFPTGPPRGEKSRQTPVLTDELLCRLPLRRHYDSYSDYFFSFCFDYP